MDSGKQINEQKNDISNKSITHNRFKDNFFAIQHVEKHVSSYFVIFLVDLAKFPEPSTI